MRSYEISCMIICQTITQLKGKYKDDFEVVDANCPEVIFLGGTENTNNEYLSKKLGTATVKGWNNSVDNKKVSASYQVDGRELLHLMVKSSVAQNKTNRDTIQLDFLQRACKVA